MKASSTSGHGEEVARTRNVKVNTMKKADFFKLFVSYAGITIILLIIASFGPSKYILAPPIEGQYLNITTEECLGDMITPIYGNSVLNCWGHRFQFTSKLTQSFVLNMNLNRDINLQSSAVDAILNFHILWQGTTDPLAQNAAADPYLASWEVVADSDVARSVSFQENAVNSSFIIMFDASSINYNSYFFQVSFLDQTSALNFFSTVSFLYSYENFDWTQYQLGYKTFFFLFSVIICGVYNVEISKVKRRVRSYEQRWVQALSGFLLLYNNPLYFLQFVAPNNYFGWLDIIFQATYVSVLLLFWLVAFDGITKDPPFAFKKFYLPKIVFIFIYWLIGIITYLSIQTVEWYNVLFNWYQNKALVNWALAYTILFALSYLSWISFLIFQGLRSMGGMTSRQLVIFTFHFTIVLATLIGSIVGTVYTASAERLTDFVYFYAIFNLYVASLAYLYAPTTDENITMEARDMTQKTQFGASVVTDIGSSSVAITSPKSKEFSPMRRTSPRKQQNKQKQTSNLAIL